MLPFLFVPVAAPRPNKARKIKSSRKHTSRPERPSFAKAAQRSCSGFTLIEIMIVTLIIGILLSIALPNMSHSRDVARQKTCVANMRQIETAKELWAMDNHKVNGDTVSLSSLVGVYITPNIPHGSQQPINFFCPSSGLPYEASIGDVGVTPLCPTIAARTGPTAHTLAP